VEMTIELPEEILQRAKITAIQRKTTLKELIYQSLLRELDEPAQAKPDPNELADAFSRGHNTDTSNGRFAREQAQCYPSPPSETLAEEELPCVTAPAKLAEGDSSWYFDQKTGFPVSRALNIPGFVPPTLAESLELIERCNEEEALSHVRVSR
jgi:hypothetical protein